MEHLVSGIIGFLTGTIASLIAPWVQWAVKKCEMRQKRRIELVETWRTILNTEPFNRKDLLNDASYSILRPLLKDKVREEIERPENHIHVKLNGPPTNPDKDLLLRELERIEKEWSLI